MFSALNTCWGYAYGPVPHTELTALPLETTEQ